MILTRDLLKTVPEGEMPNLRQYGFDVDSIPLGIDLDTLKNVALPETGDVIVSENGQTYVNTAFGKKSLHRDFQKSALSQLCCNSKGLGNSSPTCV